jgi:hypothetical protein
MYKLFRLLPLLLVAAFVSACGVIDEFATNEIETDFSVDNSVEIVPQVTSYSVTGDVEAEIAVEDGTAFTATYAEILGGDPSAFNIVMRPNGGSVPAVGVQGIPGSAGAGRTYDLAPLPGRDEASVYFQEMLVIAEGIYARSVEGTLTITARENGRVSGAFEATLAPALTDGTILGGEARYTVTGTFENIVIPNLD